MDQIDQRVVSSHKRAICLMLCSSVFTLLHAQAQTQMQAQNQSQAAAPVLRQSQQTTLAILNPPEQRFTDQKIASDLQQYEAMQERLRLLNADGQHPLHQYSMGKAQCWLDVSRHEYARNDRSAFTQLALDQAGLITRYLENPKSMSVNPALETPLINNAARLRSDLWGEIISLKSHAGAICSEAQLACAEVELVHAGNEYMQQQWRHAQPYVAIAEQKIQMARQLSQVCAEQAERMAALASLSPAPVKSLPAVFSAKPKTENWTLNGDALFRFNRYDLAGMTPQARNHLEQLVLNLKTQYQQIEHIRITGHTDYFGSPKRNLSLSRKRAASVRDFLFRHGIHAAVSIQGAGANEPLKHCVQTASKQEQILCLQENRRVEIAVLGY